VGGGGIDTSIVRVHQHGAVYEQANRRVPVPLSAIAPVLQEAFIASEDMPKRHLSDLRVGLTTERKKNPPRR